MLRVNQPAILACDEMAEMISLIKNVCGAKTERKECFLKSLFGTGRSEWEELMVASQKEVVNAKSIKDLLASYDTGSLRFKGSK